MVREILSKLIQKVKLLVLNEYLVHPCRKPQPTDGEEIILCFDLVLLAFKLILTADMEGNLKLAHI